MISLHVIGSYPVPTDPQYEIDAHNIKIIKYTHLLTEMGYVVHFYGANGCQQHVSHTYYHPVISLNDYDEAKDLTDNFTNPEYLMIGSERLTNVKSKIEKIFATNTYNLLQQNYKKGDLVLHFFQCYNYAGMINVRMSHGGGDWNMYEYVSFETIAYMEHEMRRIPNNNLKIVDTIHPWFDPNNFIYDPSNKYKTPTYLFLARCHVAKGIHFFIEYSKHYLQYNFIIAGGTLDYDPETGIMNIGRLNTPEDQYINLSIYPNVEYIGPVMGHAKKELLSRVTALIQPTVYFEPCGWNAIEAMASGTPVLVPHFGGFLDTVLNGITGYLNKPDNWIPNIERVRQIKPIDCLMHVVTNFNRDETIKSVDKFFKSIIAHTNYVRYGNNTNDYQGMEGLLVPGI